MCQLNRDGENQNQTSFGFVIAGVRSLCESFMNVTQLFTLKIKNESHYGSNDVETIHTWSVGNVRRNVASPLSSNGIQSGTASHWPV